MSTLCNGINVDKSAQIEYTTILNDVLTIFVVEESPRVRRIYLSPSIEYAVQYSERSIYIHKKVDNVEIRYWHIIDFVMNSNIALEEYKSFLSMYREDLLVLNVNDEYSII